MKQRKVNPRFVICVRNQDCDDLQLGKVYQVLPDSAAARDGYFRIVDDSQEDYLYPARMFVAITLPLAAKRALGIPRSLAAT